MSKQVVAFNTLRSNNTEKYGFNTLTNTARGSSIFHVQPNSQLLHNRFGFNAKANSLTNNVFIKREFTITLFLFLLHFLIVNRWLKVFDCKQYDIYISKHMENDSIINWLPGSGYILHYCWSRNNLAHIQSLEFTISCLCCYEIAINVSEINILHSNLFYNWSHLFSVSFP